MILHLLYWLLVFAMISRVASELPADLLGLRHYQWRNMTKNEYLQWYSKSHDRCQLSVEATLEDNEAYLNQCKSLRNNRKFPHCSHESHGAGLGHHWYLCYGPRTKSYFNRTLEGYLPTDKFLFKALQKLAGQKRILIFAGDSLTTQNYAAAKCEIFRESDTTNKLDVIDRVGRYCGSFNVSMQRNSPSGGRLLTYNPLTTISKNEHTYPYLLAEVMCHLLPHLKVGCVNF